LPFSGRVHSYPQFIVRKVPKGVEQLVLCFTGGIEFPILWNGGVDVNNLSKKDASGLITRLKGGAL